MLNSTPLGEVLDGRRLRSHIHAKVCAEQRVANIEAIGYGKGYAFSMPHWRRILQGLEAMRGERGMQVIVVAHSAVEKFSDPTNESYDRYAPRMHKSANAIVREWADNILFATMKVLTRVNKQAFGATEVKAVDDRQRVLKCTPRPMYIAKNRLQLPDEIPLDYRHFSRPAYGPPPGRVIQGGRRTTNQARKEPDDMSGNLNGFDATNVKPDAGFYPVPEGKYQCVISASGFEDTKDGKGQMLKLSLEVIEGEHKGRVLFFRLNLKNRSDEAVRIAQAQLSAICHAVGVLKPKDSSELHNKPLLITVKLKRRDDNGELSNEVKGFAAIGSQAATPAAPAAAGNAGANAPWQR